MSKAVSDIYKSIENTSSISQEQAASTQEIAANLEEINEGARNLGKYVERYK